MNHPENSHPIPVENRFWDKVKKTDTCWLWTRATRNGYGVIGRQISPTSNVRRMYYAHRLAWELLRGPIPEGMFVCHHCDVRPCVNPDHLFLGTSQDNVRDMVRKGRAFQQNDTSPFHGEKSALSKLTNKQARWIRRVYTKNAKKSPYNQRGLAQRFGVSICVIHNIVAHKTYRR